MFTSLGREDSNFWVIIGRSADRHDIHIVSVDGCPIVLGPTLEAVSLLEASGPFLNGISRSDEVNVLGVFQPIV